MIQERETRAITVELDAGGRLFVVGPNGSGKSALMHYLNSSSPAGKARWMPAHRQLWFRQDDLDIPAAELDAVDGDNKSWEDKPEARYTAIHSGAPRQFAAIADLVHRESGRKRGIERRMVNGEVEGERDSGNGSGSLLDQINELLSLAQFAVSVESSPEGRILARPRNGGPGFNLSEMSDGERSAFVIAAVVLTAKPGTALLIDEPERHLYRSIIAPFFSALFKQRQDCIFVISTQALSLPLANPSAQVLVLNSCRWDGQRAKAWDATLLKTGAELPDDLIQVITGSRTSVLFVEGGRKSLDLLLYEILFPDALVVSTGGREEVRKAVADLRERSSPDSTQVFGLIDRDNSTEDEVEQLEKSGVFTLGVSSVEGLYYCSDAISAVASRQTGSKEKADEYVQRLERESLAALKAPNVAQNIVGKKLRQREHGAAVLEHPESTEHGQSPLEMELETFNNLVDSGNLYDIISHYPLQFSDLFNTVSEALELEDRKKYESRLREQIRTDPELADKIRQRVGTIVGHLDGDGQMQPAAGRHLNSLSQGDNIK